mmetsp:Transcript_20431/g.62256  ORF Transcript_20431/g.62256 Transcript_20431/m.62256 type:complete len:269 (-) Transcript_20431:3774-4580(-)
MDSRSPRGASSPGAMLSPPHAMGVQSSPRSSIQDSTTRTRRAALMRPRASTLPETLSLSPAASGFAPSSRRRTLRWLRCTAARLPARPRHAATPPPTSKCKRWWKQSTRSTTAEALLSRGGSPSRRGMCASITGTRSTPTGSGKRSAAICPGTSSRTAAMWSSGWHRAAPTWRLRSRALSPTRRAAFSLLEGVPAECAQCSASTSHTSSPYISTQTITRNLHCSNGGWRAYVARLSSTRTTVTTSSPTSAGPPWRLLGRGDILCSTVC